MRYPRIMISAGSSGSGKTLFTCGILQALKNRGVRTAAYKCGPDYIDPMFHTKVLGIDTGNLDSFFTDSDTMRQMLAEDAPRYDAAVIEGVMGYYDGLGGTTVRASAYEVAQQTGTPAVLLVDCRGVSLSAAASIMGFQQFQPDSRIKGVILNRISPMLYGRLKKEIENRTAVRVLGYLPEQKEFQLESRHLGLLPPHEVEQWQERIRMLADTVEHCVDIEGLLALAEEAEELPAARTEEKANTSDVRIGVARDEAFCFLYKENLKYLQCAGAELVYFSPLHDKKFPEDIQGCILPGGYPELYGKALSENRDMLEGVRNALVMRGLPCIAECGGFLYLHRAMEGTDGRMYPMAGVIDAEAVKKEKLQNFGYVDLYPNNKTIFGKRIQSLKGHEFHYYSSSDCGSDFQARKPVGSRQWVCIHHRENLLAGFPHFYFRGNEELPEAFLAACREQSGEGV